MNADVVRHCERLVRRTNCVRAIFLFASSIHDDREDCLAAFLATAKTVPRNDKPGPASYSFGVE